MSHSVPSRLVAPVGAACVALSVLLALFAPTTGATDHCVAPGGPGACFASIQEAVDAAAAGDTIRVVAGTYAENVAIDQDLTLLGGYDDTALTARTPRTSIVDGGFVDSVVRIGNGARVTIDGFIVQNGDGTTQQGRGGGIRVEDGALTLRNNLIRWNVGSSDPAVAGSGGGVYVSQANAPISVTLNTIVGNVAYGGSPAEGQTGLAGAGGGLWLERFGDAVLTGNVITGNHAVSLTAISTTANAFGGGMGFFDGLSITLVENDISSNRGMGSGARILGGGVAGFRVGAVTMRTNVVNDNLGATTVADAQGGGIYLSMDDTNASRASFDGNVVLRNLLADTLVPGSDSGSAFAAGGGVRVWGGNSDEDHQVAFAGNTVGDNQIARSVQNTRDGAFRGGGIVVEEMRHVTLNGDAVAANTIAGNAQSSSGAGTDWGGSLDGGGLYVGDSAAVTLTNLSVADNLVAARFAVDGMHANGGGGGMTIDRCPSVTVVGGTYSNNVVFDELRVGGSGERNASCNGGGMNLGGYGSDGDIVTLTDVVLSANICARNAERTGADMAMHVEGGGLTVRGFDTVQATGVEVDGNVAAVDVTVVGNGADAYTGRSTGGGLTVSDVGVLRLRAVRVTDNTTVQVFDANAAEAHAVGGGLFANQVFDLLAEDSDFLRNLAVMTATVSGNPPAPEAASGANSNFAGGGALLECWGDDACRLQLHRNDFLDNVAVHDLAMSGPETWASVSGGGLAFSNFVSATVAGNTIGRNVSAETLLGAGSARVHVEGGGLAATARDDIAAELLFYNNAVANNAGAMVVTMSGAEANVHEEGGGAVFHQMARLEIMSNTVSSNVAVDALQVQGNGNGAWPGRPAGGGIMANDSIAVNVGANVFQDNLTARTITLTGAASSSEGGALALIDVVTARVEGNAFTGNMALERGSVTGNGGEGLYAQGGALMLACWNSDACAVAVDHNRFVANVGIDEVTVTGADAGGGGEGGAIAARERVDLTMRGNLFQDNKGNLSSDRGRAGAVHLRQVSAVFDANRFDANRSVPDDDRNPVVWGDDVQLRSTNDIFMGNMNGAFGVDGRGDGATVAIVNGTFYANDQVGIYVERGAYVTVTNTIVVDHERGLQLDDSEASLFSDYNLLNNDGNYAGGVVQGGHDLVGADPQFVNAVGGDLHPAQGSPAIDRGTNAGAPSTDYDGVSRPQDGDDDGVATTDIGAYERPGISRVYLPLIDE